MNELRSGYTAKRESDIANSFFLNNASCTVNIELIGGRQSIALKNVIFSSGL